MNHMLRWFGSLLILIVAVVPSARAKSRHNSNSPDHASGKAQHYTSMARNPYLGAIVEDAATGKVLFQDQADTRGYPASMQKLMDLLIILERIEHGQLSLTDQVPVSAKAAKTGGSQVWLAEKESFTVDDMLYALMVQSANDAAVVP